MARKRTGCFRAIKCAKQTPSGDLSSARKATVCAPQVIWNRAIGRRGRPLPDARSDGPVPAELRTFHLDGLLPHLHGFSCLCSAAGDSGVNDKGAKDYCRSPWRDVRAGGRRLPSQSWRGLSRPHLSTMSLETEFDVQISDEQAGCCTTVRDVLDVLALALGTARDHALMLMARTARSCA